MSIEEGYFEEIESVRNPFVCPTDPAELDQCEACQ